MSPRPHSVSDSVGLGGMRSSSSCDSICTLVPDDSDLSDSEQHQSGWVDKSDSTSYPTKGSIESDEPVDHETARQNALDFLASSNISLPATYAEATNLAAKFPQHGPAILSLPIRPVRPSDTASDGKSTNDDGGPSSSRPLPTKISCSISAHTTDQPNWAVAPDQPERLASRSQSRGRSRQRQPDTSKPRPFRNERRSKDARHPSASFDQSPERNFSSVYPIHPLHVIRSLQVLADEQKAAANDPSRSSSHQANSSLSPLQVHVRVPTDDIRLSAPAFTKVASNPDTAVQLQRPYPSSTSPSLPRQHLPPPHRHSLSPQAAPLRLPAVSHNTPRHHHVHQQSARVPIQTQHLGAPILVPQGKFVKPGQHPHQHHPFNSPQSLRRGPVPYTFLPPAFEPASAGAPKPLTITTMSESDMSRNLPDLMRRMMLGLDADGAPGNAGGSMPSTPGSGGWASREIVFGEGGSPRSPLGEGGRRYYNRGRSGSGSGTSSCGQPSPMAPTGPAQMGRPPPQAGAGDYFSQRFVVPHAAPLHGGGRFYPGAHGISRQRSAGEPPVSHSPVRVVSSGVMSRSLAHSAQRVSPNGPRAMYGASSPALGQRSQSPFSQGGNAHNNHPAFQNPTAALDEQSRSPFSPPPMQDGDVHNNHPAIQHNPNKNENVAYPIPHTNPTHTQRHSYTYTQSAKSVDRPLSLDEIMSLLPHEGLTHPVLYEYVKAQMDAGMDAGELLKGAAAAAAVQRGGEGVREDEGGGQKGLERVVEEEKATSVLPEVSPTNAVYVQAGNDGWVSFGHGRPVSMA